MKHIFLILTFLSITPSYDVEFKIEQCNGLPYDGNETLFKRAIQAPYEYPPLSSNPTDKEKCQHYILRSLAELSNPKFTRPFCDAVLYNGQPCTTRPPQCGSLNGKEISNYPTNLSSLCAIGKPNKISVFTVFDRLKVIDQNSKYKEANVTIESIEWYCMQPLSDSSRLLSNKCQAKTTDNFDLMSAIPHYWQFKLELFSDGFEPKPTSRSWTRPPSKLIKKTTNCPRKDKLVCYEADKYTTKQTFYKPSANGFTLDETTIWRNCPLGKFSVVKDDQISCVGVFGELSQLLTFLESSENSHYQLPTFEQIQQLERDGYLFDSTTIAFYWTKTYRNPVGSNGEIYDNIHAGYRYKEKNKLWMTDKDIGQLYTIIAQ